MYKKQLDLYVKYMAKAKEQSAKGNISGYRTYMSYANACKVSAQVKLKTAQTFLSIANRYR